MEDAVAKLYNVEKKLQEEIHGLDEAIAAQQKNLEQLTQKRAQAIESGLRLEKEIRDLERREKELLQKLAHLSLKTHEQASNDRGAIDDEQNTTQMEIEMARGDEQQSLPRDFGSQLDDGPGGPGVSFETEDSSMTLPPPLPEVLTQRDFTTTRRGRAELTYDRDDQGDQQGNFQEGEMSRHDEHANRSPGSDFQHIPGNASDDPTPNALAQVVARALNGQPSPYSLTGGDKLVLAVTYAKVIQLRALQDLDTAEDCKQEVSRLRLVKQLPLHLSFAFDFIVHKVVKKKSDSQQKTKKKARTESKKPVNIKYQRHPILGAKQEKMYDLGMDVASVLEAGATILGSLHRKGSNRTNVQNASQLGKDLRKIAIIVRKMKDPFRELKYKNSRKPRNPEAAASQPQQEEAQCGLKRKAHGFDEGSDEDEDEDDEDEDDEDEDDEDDEEAEEAEEAEDDDDDE